MHNKGTAMKDQLTPKEQWNPRVPGEPHDTARRWHYTPIKPKKDWSLALPFIVIAATLALFSYQVYTYNIFSAVLWR